MRLHEYFDENPDTQPAFAARVGVSQSAVSQWVNQSRTCKPIQIKPENVLKVAAETGWRVTPHELRPEIYPRADDGMPRPGAGAPAPALAVAST